MDGLGVRAPGVVFSALTALQRAAIPTLISPPMYPKQATLVICVLGIYSCYLSAGMLQEAISSYRAPDGGRYGARGGGEVSEACKLSAS